MRILLLLLFVLPVIAQNPPVAVPAGQIYQAALTVGINYISPQAGQAIVNQKSLLNWKTIAGEVLSDGSIGVLTGGLAGVISIGKVTEVSLAAFHAFYDHSIAPIIAEGEPNPNNIPPVLAMNGTVSPSASTCAEYSMYATPPGGTAKTAMKLLKSGQIRASAGNVNVGGLTVSFTLQGVQVLKNISGGSISQFVVYDVLACLSTPSVPTSPGSSTIAPMHPTEFPSGTAEHLCSNGVSSWLQSTPCPDSPARTSPVKPTGVEWNSQCFDLKTAPAWCWNTMLSLETGQR
jgi:hypothetical protein